MDKLETLEVIARSRGRDGAQHELEVRQRERDWELSSVSSVGNFLLVQACPMRHKVQDSMMHDARHINTAFEGDVQMRKDNQPKQMKRQSEKEVCDVFKRDTWYGCENGHKVSRTNEKMRDPEKKSVGLQTRDMRTCTTAGRRQMQSAVTALLARLQALKAWLEPRHR